MGRPLFLIGTTPLYLLGVAAAWHDTKTVHVSLLLSGLFLVWLIQLMTHYNNEYHDLETDLATETATRISGGSRVLVKRLVPRITARIAAMTALLLAIALAAVMVVVMNAGRLTLGFAGAAEFLGWFYSARPLRLESTGAGELVTIAVSCFLVPLMSYYLQVPIIKPIILIACAPVGLLTLALILTSEIPDFHGDRSTGKKTMVVRFGRARAIWLINAALVTGWLGFSVVVIYRQPFWGWISTAVSVPMLAMIGLNVKGSSKLSLASLERMGLIISLLLGYASISLALAFLV
jgi:1,4-dihydroxy-2-naphthoate polyprenyltransferase